MAIHITSPAPPPPDADKPRVVVEYSGMQILNCREHVQVLLGSNPPRGIRGSLRIEGFKENDRGIWEAALTPRNIMSAQAIGNTYFKDGE